MDSDQRDLSALPIEILLTAFSHLGKTDLASVRETCKKLSPIASKLYFKNCMTSFLHLDQLLLLSNHVELSQYVEHLGFQETCFKLQQEPLSDQGLAQVRSNRLEKMVSTILYPNDGIAYRDTVISRRIQYDDDPPPNLKPELAHDLLTELISGTLEEFHVQDAFQESLAAYRLIKLAIRGLPALKRVTFLNARDHGIHVDTGFMPKSLQMLNEYFPISEGLFQVEFNPRPDPPHQGFLQVLAAFQDLDRDIEEISVQHNGGFLTSGICMMAIRDFPQHLQALVLPAFRRIRHLHLKISLFDTGPGTPIAALGDKPFLVDALLEATQLHSLDLCFESASTNLGGCEDIVPTSKVFPALHTLRLSDIAFNTPAKLVRFLCHGLPLLRNLSIRQCRLDGTWSDMFQRLSDSPRVRLNALETSGLYDLVNLGDQSAGGAPQTSEWEGCCSRCHRECLLRSSCISSTTPELRIHSTRDNGGTLITMIINRDFARVRRCR